MKFEIEGQKHNLLLNYDSNILNLFINKSVAIVGSSGILLNKEYTDFSKKFENEMINGNFLNFLINNLNTNEDYDNFFILIKDFFRNIDRKNKIIEFVVAGEGFEPPT